MSAGVERLANTFIFFCVCEKIGEQKINRRSRPGRNQVVERLFPACEGPRIISGAQDADEVSFVSLFEFGSEWR